MHNFKELKIWQKAKEIAKDVYILCEKLPSSERFGYISQLQRAAISVASNIAEGSGRGDKEFVRFIDIAISSSYEVENLLLIGIDINYLDKEVTSAFISEINELQKMMIGFKKSLMKSEI